MERFCILCNFWFVKGKPCSCCSGNLLTAPVLALRCLQFKTSTHHSSQLTGHEIYRKHYRELEKRNRTCFSPFHNENTENKQRLQKCPKFIWEKLDDIGFEKFPESYSPGEKICQPCLEKAKQCK